MTTNHEGQERLAELEANPQDQDLQAALRVQIKKMTLTDQHFAEKLGHLLRMEPQHVGDNISMQAGNNSTLIGKVQGDANFGADWRAKTPGKE